MRKVKRKRNKYYALKKLIIAGCDEVSLMYHM